MIKNVFIAVILVVMLPLLFGSISEAGKGDTQELKGFSARDIQFLESIGFVSNGNGSWTLTGGIPTFTSQTPIYTFDYKPIAIAWNMNTKITSIQVINSNTIRYYTIDNFYQVTSSNTTLWGGDVS